MMPRQGCRGLLFLFLAFAFAPPSSSSPLITVASNARQCIPPPLTYAHDTVAVTATIPRVSAAAAATAALPRGGFFWPRKEKEAEGQRGKRAKKLLPILEVSERSSQAELEVAETRRERRAAAAAAAAAASNQRSALDRTIDFLEAPGTDMAIGITTILLVSYELGREIRKLGYAKALGDLNMALVSIVIARFLKALLACLKSTKQALRGYRTYAIVKRGKNVYLRQVPAASSDDDHVDVI